MMTTMSKNYTILALRTLLINYEDIAEVLERNRKDLIREDLRKKIAVEALLEDYSHDYYSMLEDFGENDELVIRYGKLIEFLKELLAKNKIDAK